MKTEFGNLTRVWKDLVNGLIPFNMQFPQLFDICTVQECTVERFSAVDASYFFGRRLCPTLAGQWWEMCEHISGIRLTTKNDVVYWGLNKNAKFLIKSMYKWLEKPLSGCNYKWIWKAKLPLKIQIFMWQLSQNVVLTRQVMKSRKWPCNPSCSFCNELETATHLFFTCPVAQVIWRSVGVV